MYRFWDLEGWPSVWGQSESDSISLYKTQPLQIRYLQRATESVYVHIYPSHIDLIKISGKPSFNSLCPHSWT